MPNRGTLIVWWALLSAAGVAVALAAQATAQGHGALLGVAAGALLVAVAGSVPGPARHALTGVFRALHLRPAPYWLLLLLGVFGALAAWVAAYQPTYGGTLPPAGWAWLALTLWAAWALIAFGWDQPTARLAAERLGASRWAGLLTSATFLVLVLAGAEASLRLFYITTDSYGFTAMNYHWYNNFYWGRTNSLGYRDHEPKPDAPGLVRVAVVGDSFVIGHGMTDLDATLSQIVERQLPAHVDVLVLAQSGWDSDVQRGYLEAFPLRPDVVVLSYYLNDIDWLLDDPALNPDNNFTFPQNRAVAWVVLNYFVPNYLYYNLLQFTSPARNTNFVQDLVNAHLDAALWPRQADALYQFVRYTRAQDMPLVVLVWPHLAMIDDSRPATDLLTRFFTDEGAIVVNMADVLADEPPRALMVNRFDAHPSPRAHRLAAEALVPVLRPLVE